MKLYSLINTMYIPDNGSSIFNFFPLISGFYPKPPLPVYFCCHTCCRP